jgi:Replication initiator protein A
MVWFPKVHGKKLQIKCICKMSKSLLSLKKIGEKSFFQRPAKIVEISDLSWYDINLPEFCLGIIGRVPEENQNSKIVYQDSKYPERKIIITRQDEGFPVQSTRDLLLVLARLNQRQNNFTENKVAFSGGMILKELGLTVCGKNMKDLKRDLARLTGTRIVFENSFYDKEKKEHRTLDMGVVSAIATRETTNLDGSMVSDDDLSFGTYLTWSDEFFSASFMNFKNLIQIDFSSYMQLSGDITKQLFKFLSKRRFSKEIFSISVSVLAYEKLGISKTVPLKKAKFNLKKCHDQLQRTGFIDKEPSFFNKDNGDLWVEYDFSTVKNIISQEVVLSGSQEVVKYGDQKKIDQLDKYFRESSGEIEDEKKSHKNVIDVKVSESLKVGKSKSQEAGNFENNNGEFIDIDLSENMEVGISVNQKDEKPESQEVDFEQETKKRFMELGLTEANFGKMINKYTYQKILDGLDLLAMEIKNGTKIRSKKKWFLACLNQGFDTDSLFADRKKEEGERLEKLRQKILEKDEQARAVAEQQETIIRNKKIDDWMAQNPFEVVEECERYVEELISKGGMMADKLTKLSQEQNKRPSKAILDHPLYLGTLRNRIWVKIEG